MSLWGHSKFWNNYGCLFRNMSTMFRLSTPPPWNDIVVLVKGGGKKLPPAAGGLARMLSGCRVKDSEVHIVSYIPNIRDTSSGPPIWYRPIPIFRHPLILFSVSPTPRPHLFLSGRSDHGSVSATVKCLCQPGSALGPVLPVLLSASVAGSRPIRAAVTSGWSITSVCFRRLQLVNWR